MDYSKLEYEDLFTLAEEQGDAEAWAEIARRREIRLAQLAARQGEERHW